MVPLAEIVFYILSGDDLKHNFSLLLLSVLLESKSNQFIWWQSLKHWRGWEYYFQKVKEKFSFKKPSVLEAQWYKSFSWDKLNTVSSVSEPKLLPFTFVKNPAFSSVSLVSAPCATSWARNFLGHLSIGEWHVYGGHRLTLEQDLALGRTESLVPFGGCCGSSMLFPAGTRWCCSTGLSQPAALPSASISPRDAPAVKTPFLILKVSFSHSTVCSKPGQHSGNLLVSFSFRNSSAPPVFPWSMWSMWQTSETRGYC